MGRFLTGSVTFAAVALSSSFAWASFPSMGKMLPADTNAVVAVDLEKIMASDVARQNNWGSKWTNSWEYGALTVPPGTKQVLGASRVLRTMDDAKWRLSLMELKEQDMIPITDIARAESGYVDNLWGKKGVISPAGTIFVQMSPELLASWTPADRQNVVNWLHKPVTGGPDSDFLVGIINGTNRDAAVAMGINMADMYSPVDIRRAIDRQGIIIEDPKADLETISQVISTIQNVSLKVSFTDKINGKIEIGFGMSAAIMEFYAKTAMIGVLNRSDISIPEIKDWKVTTKDKIVTIEGDLQPDSVKAIFAMVTMPAPNIIDAKQMQPSNDPAVIGQVSLTYFRAFGAVLDQFKPSGGMGENAQILARESKRLAGLPLINVDPELAAWGTEVSSKLQSIAISLRADQQDVKSKMTGVMNPGGSGSGGYGWSGGYSNDGGYNGNYWQSNTVARQNAQRQRSQALTETRAAAIRDAGVIVTKMNEERNDLRAKLTQKYGMNF